MDRTVGPETICKNMNVCFHTGPVTLALTSSERTSEPEVDSDPEAKTGVKPEAQFVEHVFAESRSKRAAKENNVIRIMHLADIHVDPKYAVVSMRDFWDSEDVPLLGICNLTVGREITTAVVISLLIVRLPMWRKNSSIFDNFSNQKLQFCLLE